jgi:ACR3 family arsenite efflux pump ArsB
MNILRWIKSHLITSIFISIGTGLVVGYFFDVSWMRHLIMPLTFMLVYPMMVTLKLSSIFEKMNGKLQAVTVVTNFVIFPLIAYVIGQLFFQQEPYFQLGLLLIALFPTSGMTVSWTILAKGNVQEAIKMVVFGLLIAALLSPIYIKLFMGASIAVPFMKIFTNILLVVFVPLILAYVTQVVLIKKYSEETFHQSIKKQFPLFSTLGVVIIIMVAVALRARVIIDNPDMLLSIMIPLLLLYASFFIVSVVISRLWFSREDGIAYVNGTLIRSLSLSLAITLGVFEGAGIAALLIAIAYVIQVQVAAFTVKWNGRIFKSTVSHQVVQVAQK